jgi:hypothetical protein
MTKINNLGDHRDPHKRYPDYLARKAWVEANFVTEMDIAQFATEAELIAFEAEVNAEIANMVTQDQIADMVHEDEIADMVHTADIYDMATEAWVELYYYTANYCDDTYATKDDLAAATAIYVTSDDYDTFVTNITELVDGKQDAFQVEAPLIYTPNGAGVDDLSLDTSNIALKDTDFASPVTADNRGVTEAELMAVEVGYAIGQYDFGWTGQVTGITMPDPENIDQTMFDFTVNTPAIAAQSGDDLIWQYQAPITELPDGATVYITALFWDISTTNQGGYARYINYTDTWAVFPSAAGGQKPLDAVLPLSIDKTSAIHDVISINDSTYAKVDVVNNALNGKVDKRTTTGHFIYAHENGVEQELPVLAGGTTASTIVGRTQTGTIKAANGTATNDVVTLAQMNAAIAAVQNRTNVTDIATASISVVSSIGVGAVSLERYRVGNVEYVNILADMDISSTWNNNLTTCPGNAAFSAILNPYRGSSTEWQGLTWSMEGYYNTGAPTVSYGFSWDAQDGNLNIGGDPALKHNYRIRARYTLTRRF